MSEKAIAMMRRFDLALVLMLGALLPGPALAHAAFLSAQEVQAISIRGQYDTGAPMNGAQVTVYAPDNPAQPWTTGTADALGRFLLFPDRSLTGRWTIQMRQAGHGAIIHVEIGERTTSTASLTAIAATGSDQSPLQRVLMVVLVAWGALGTGLFVMRNRKGRDASA
jgi:nickel transport protein